MRPPSRSQVSRELFWCPKERNMMRKITRNYEFSPVEVREAIFYWLANAKDYPVPSSYDDAIITWDSTQKVYIEWTDTISEEMS
jgi:hypothetical protein